MLESYRKKDNRQIVHAELLTEDSVDRIANWSQSQIVEEKDALSGEAQEGLNVKTPQGKKRASLGDYVVEHAGSYYVVSESQFESLYDKVHVGIEMSQVKNEGETNAG